MIDHTPGPWVVKTPWGKGSEFRDVVAPGVLGFEARCKRGNANLIAAAPELYKALDALVVAAWPVPRDPHELSIAVRTAKAAIAKAEGRDD